MKYRPNSRSMQTNLGSTKTLNKQNNIQRSTINNVEQCKDRRT